MWINEPVTIKRIDGEVDIFMMDYNYGLQHSSFNFLIGHGIGPWKNLGGKLLSPPAVANRKGTVHIFHVGTDRALYHNSWDGANHSPFERLLGEVMHTHSPAAVSAGAQEVSVFAVGLADARLYHYHWSSTSGAGKQSDLETISGSFHSVDCISWGPGRIDIFGSNLASGVSHKAWDGKTWSEWKSWGVSYPGWARVGGQWLNEPVTIKRIDGEVDIFMMDHNHGLQQCNFNFLIGHPGPWTNLGGKLLSPPASVECISWGPGRIDIFGSNLASGVSHKAWDGKTWSEWEELGGVKVCRTTPVSHSPGSLCILVVGIAGIMFIRVRDPKTGVWGAWTNLGGTIVSRVA
ncbi:hypothetical protein JB92DRAFT_2704477 [Gautieria morchelliformis]|nr:hypothetical protein JB92DRAFT_2704477 [Gautieria morchelliformis]